MAEEEPFLAGQRTWERADMLVAGTPEIPFDPASEVAAANPVATTAADGISHNCQEIICRKWARDSRPTG
jgi:hypothetical protein